MDAKEASRQNIRNSLNLKRVVLRVLRSPEAEAISLQSGVIVVHKNDIRLPKHGAEIRVEREAVKNEIV
jgi:hypothetical protein